MPHWPSTSAASVTPAPSSTAEWRKPPEAIMVSRLRNWLLFPVRTPARAAVSAVVLAALALAGWQGLRVLRFHQDRTAAEEALAAHDFPRARRLLASCLDQRPHDPAVLLLAAQAARRDGYLDDAQEYLDRYQARVRTATPEGALQWALLRVQQGLVKENVHDLIAQVDIRHPASEQILEALAQGCVHVYRLDEASFWTKQLLDRFPDNPVGRLIHAQTTETLGRLDRAGALMQALVEDYPENDRARLFLARILTKGRQYEEAAQHFRELRRRQPGDVMILLGLVRALLPLEQLDEAGPLLRELEEEHADNSEAMLECGRFALRQKRPADAERLLRRALELAPHDHEIHYHLSVCLQQLERPEESRRHLARFKQIEDDLKRLEQLVEATVKKPSEPGPRLEAGQICLRNGQAAEGLRWLYGVLDLVPAHKPTHQALAEHFESIGDSPRAEYHRQRAR
jgi:predicted Zn-dependent protease